MLLGLTSLVTAPADAATFDAWLGRFAIELEETTPTPVELSAVENRSFFTRALQVRAIVACPEAQPRGKHNAELACRIEAIGLHATPRSVELTARALEDSNAVLSEMATSLTGTRLLVTVTDDGRVTTVELPDVQANNRRQSERREILRRIAFDMAAPLSLRRPDDWAGGWTEKNSALLHPPTQSAATGLTRTEHVVSTVDGATIAQSTGSGTFTAPYEPWEFEYKGKVADDVSTSGGPDYALGSKPSAVTSPITPGSRTPSANVPTDYTFTGDLTGVAVLDANARPIERVWAMVGRPTASSLGQFQGSSIWYAGRLRKLTDGETFDVGSTAVVAPPGASVPGLEPWNPLDTF